MRPHKIGIVVLVVIAVVVVLQVKASRAPLAEPPNMALTETDSMGPIEPQIPAKPQMPADQPEAEPEPRPAPPAQPEPEPAPQPVQVSSPEPKPEPAPPASLAPEPETPAALPRMVDVGSEHCIPCKMMAPVLDELQREYAGKISVEFVNLAQDPKAGNRYGVRVIPTQIFIDSSGQEVFRHVGFYSKEDILAKFKELGFTN